MAKIARVALVLALAAAASGCVSILTAIAGGDARARRAAGELDAAMLGAIAEGIGEGVTAAADSSPPPHGEDVVYADGELWLCRLEGDEIQEINAHSIEGARAACIMSNDVDLVPNGCDCIAR